MDKNTEKKIRSLSEAFRKRNASYEEAEEKLTRLAEGLVYCSMEDLMEVRSVLSRTLWPTRALDRVADRQYELEKKPRLETSPLPEGWREELEAAMDAYVKAEKAREPHRKALEDYVMAYVKEQGISKDAEKLDELIDMVPGGGILRFRLLDIKYNDQKKQEDRP